MQGPSTFWVRGPIYILHIILRAAVIADYKIIMDILNIILGACAATRWRRWSAYGVGCASFSNPNIASPTSQLNLQPFHSFTYVTAHSTALPLLHLRHSSFANPSAALPTSQVIPQTFLCFTYVTGTSRGEPCIGGWKTVCGGIASYSKLLSLEVPTVLGRC